MGGWGREGTLPLVIAYIIEIEDNSKKILLADAAGEDFALSQKGLTKNIQFNGNNLV